MCSHAWTDGLFDNLFSFLKMVRAAPQVMDGTSGEPTWQAGLYSWQATMVLEIFLACCLPPFACLPDQVDSSWTWLWLLHATGLAATQCLAAIWQEAQRSWMNHGQMLSKGTGKALQCSLATMHLCPAELAIVTQRLLW